ncbi:MAG: metallophosphoesterase family protein [Anaerolineae bacterium]|nr:metallophosphoesterase family protein [Anaerolineae bacterium]MDW8171908.1 metallophosphoesterase family protein [Anaerolineae bacterium]
MPSTTSFLALPDLHDKADAVKAITRPLSQADFVLLPGDMTNGSVHHLLRLLDIVEEVNEAIYAVPGNLDTPQILAHLSREGCSLHRTHVAYEDFVLAGIGGALPFAGKFVFSEAQLATMLEEAVRGAPNLPLVLVCHQPPYGTACDCLSDGQHVGSRAVRDFILRVQPLLCFTGHIHEAQAVDTLGQTRIINPGPLWLSQAYAYAEIRAGQVTSCEIRPITPDDILSKRSSRPSEDDAP